MSVDEAAALPPPPRRRGRASPLPRRTTRRLSREAILDAALRVVDTEGLAPARAGLGIIQTGEQTLPLTEAILSAGGVSQRVAALSVELLALYLTATAVEESLEARSLAGGPDDLYARELREYWSTLPPDRFPHLSAMAVALTSGDGDARFGFGLEILIRGIASTVLN